MKKLLAFILAFVVIFASTSMIGFATTEDTIDSFSVSAISFTEETVPTVEWFLADDGNYYLFIPTSISTALCRVSFVADGDVTIDDYKVQNGGMVSLAGKSSISVSCGAKTYNVKIIAETELASVFITTESGSLDAIYANKEHKEAGYIQVIGEDGFTYEYNGDLEYIKGRGNSTWKMEKKPYNIKLDKKADLFGMGKSKKWSLIANHGDTTLMRNAIIYSVAGEVLDYTPKYTPVDLYINNDYMGSFILTTRVEADDNRVEIDNLDDANEDANPDVDFDTLPLAGTRGQYSGLMEGTQKWVEIPNDPADISGGYLMEMEIADRYDSEISGFVSNGGQPVIFKNPEYATESEVKYISGIYQNFEDAVMSEDGYNANGDYYTELCNAGTFQKFYAINEWASNMDCGLTSTYMYKPQGDEKLYAGPVWDFDIALGNNENDRYGCNYMNPEEFTVCFGRQYKNTIFGQADIKKVPTLFNALCQKEDFVAGVKNVWDNEILDVLNVMNESGIDAYADKIEGSAVANAIRWNIYGTTNIDSIKSEWNVDVDFVKDFSTRRAIFLTNNFGTVQTTDVESGALDGILSGLGDVVEGIIGGGIGGDSGNTDTTPDTTPDTDTGTDTDNNTDNTDNDTNADTNGNVDDSDIPDTVAGASIVVAAAVAIASGVGIVATIKKREE